MRRSSRKRRQLQTMTDISMTSMIDTAWTLLVIFIIAAPIMQHGIKVNLPQGAAKEHYQKPKDIVVFIDQAGAMYYEGSALSLEQIVSAVKKATSAEKKTVIVKADSKVVCGQLFTLVDKIKLIDGIQHVVFATQNKSKQQA